MDHRGFSTTTGLWALLTALFFCARALDGSVGCQFHAPGRVLHGRGVGLSFRPVGHGGTSSLTSVIPTCPVPPPIISDVNLPFCCRCTSAESPIAILPTETRFGSGRGVLSDRGASIGAKPVLARKGTRAGVRSNLWRNPGPLRRISSGTAHRPLRHTTWSRIAEKRRKPLKYVVSTIDRNRFLRHTGGNHG